MELNGRSILITGGSGSFGHVAVETILERHRPSRLIVFSRDELKQSEMQLRFSDPCLRFFLGDVRDRDRLCQAMAGVDYVIHAAAMKQVPAAEYNPMECIKTNIHGAENVIQAALASNVEQVVALSTDKAASPINLYGATKLVSDKLFVAANNVVGTHRTRFAVVRYGNVVGSRGSVVPLFRHLIATGAEALPITDNRMTRFWIRLEEGVDFALQAFDRMLGGEILVPKLPSVRITDLAKAMAPDMELESIGIRPGEKVHEVMCPADDSHLTIEFDEYFVIRPSIAYNASPESFFTSHDGQAGRSVPPGFQYDSGSNGTFLTVDEIRQLNMELFKA